MSLDSIIDKKKVFQETRVLVSGDFVGLSSAFPRQIGSMGLCQPFETHIDAKTKVMGIARLCGNEFTAMPKGSFNLVIEELS